MAPQLKPEQRAQIVAFFEAGWTYSKISTKMGTSKSTVSRTIKKFKERKTFENAPKTGRRKSLSEQEENKITNYVQKHEGLPLRKYVLNIKNEYNIQISHTFLSNLLKSKGIFPLYPVYKPKLTPKHKIRRKELSKKFMFMSRSERLRIVFSDETRFCLNGNDSKKKIWFKKGIKNPKRIKETTKFPKSVMVWGCFSHLGVGKLVIVDKNVNSAVYIDLLNENLLDSVSKMGLPDFHFQHDNAPAHRSKLTKDFLKEIGVEVLDWPAQSPDLNPIENLWAYLKKLVYARSPRTLEELKEFILDEWRKIPQELCDRLVKSFNDRILQCYNRNGSHTDY